MAKTPQSCQIYKSDYKASAWEAYTLAELGQWVHLFTKRAEHRTNFAKKDKDLRDAQNYLNMMQSKLDEVKALTLEKFGATILRELTAGADVALSDKPHDGNSIYVDWKIRNDDPVRGFEDLYTLYIKPALMSLVKELNDIDEVFVLEMDHDACSLGNIVSIIQSKNMAARLKTRYDSDSGGGPNAGVVMSIEVGVVKD